MKQEEVILQSINEICGYQKGDPIKGSYAISITQNHYEFQRYAGEDGSVMEIFSASKKQTFLEKIQVFRKGLLTKNETWESYCFLSYFVTKPPIVLVEDDFSDLDPNSIFITYLHVDPQFRRNGYGRKYLLKKLASWKDKTVYLSFNPDKNKDIDWLWNLFVSSGFLPERAVYHATQKPLLKKMRGI